MWTTAVTLCFWLSAQLLPSVNLYQNQTVADFHLKLFFRWTVIKVQANPLKAFFCVFSIFPVLHVVPVTVGQTALLKALLCPSCCCLLMTMFPVVVQSTSWSQRHWADVSCWEASLLPKSEMRSLTALRTAASGAGFGFFIIVMKKYQQHLWATIWTLIIFKKFNLWSTNSLKRFIFTSQINSFCVCVHVCVCARVCVDLCSAVGGVRSVGVSTLKVRRSLGLEPAAQLLIVRNTKTHTSDITDHMMQEVWKSAVNLLLCS